MIFESEISFSRLKIEQNSTRKQHFTAEDLEQIRDNLSLNQSSLPSGNTLLCINVPKKVNIYELLSILASHLEKLTSIQVFHSEEASSYATLLKMEDDSTAAALAEEHNFSRISPFEADHLEFGVVQKIAHPPVSPSKRQSEVSNLKNCSICLESLDYTESLDTAATIRIVCGHSFHLSCLSKFTQNKCPLCRSFLSPPEFATCKFCSQTEDLWLCLICGEVLCGSAKHSSQHREDHFKNTTHRYLKSISNRKMVFDCFKLKTISEQVALLLNPEQSELYSDSDKISLLVSEYNSLVDSQIESQREYYENLVKTIENDTLAEEESLLSLLEQERALIAAEEEETLKLQKEAENLEELVKTAAEKKILLSEEVKTVDNQIKKLKKKKKKVAKHAENSVEVLKAELLALNEELNAVNEETKDMTFHLNNAKKFKKA